jgi:hypothetical protein
MKCAKVYIINENVLVTEPIVIKKGELLIIYKGSLHFNRYGLTNNGCLDVHESAGLLFTASSKDCNIVNYGEISLTKPNAMMCNSFNSYVNFLNTGTITSTFDNGLTFNSNGSETCINAFNYGSISHVNLNSVNGGFIKYTELTPTSNVKIEKDNFSTVDLHRL